MTRRKDSRICRVCGQREFAGALHNHHLVRDSDDVQKEEIQHPQHYGGDTVYEAIKVIEAWQLGFNLGNATKYICRAGKKGDALKDLKKAEFYLKREIAKLESAK